MFVRRGTSIDSAQELVSLSATPRVRTMREFAEQEVKLPNGPYANLRFRCGRIPWTGVLFDAIDSGQWPRIAMVGPSQSGKTLVCHVIPQLYHLFEMQETVINGVPDQTIASDKWAEDLMPVIRATRYAAHLPDKGEGARGGVVKTAVRFTHGHTLRFMTGGGNDKSRSAFTARVLAVTETDGMDTAKTTSRESNPIDQLEARQQSFDRRRRGYFECTASFEHGFIWRNYVAGTKSRLLMPCVHCGEWVLPEEEHVIGWQDAENKLDAAENGGFACPACGEMYSDEQRREMNHDMRLVHRGQTITKGGDIEGDPPRTDTLGFRYSAFHNLLISSGSFAAQLYKKAHAEDPDEADRETRQVWFAFPAKDTAEELVEVKQESLMRRVSELPRGHLPEGTASLVVACDLGRYVGHWLALAFDDDGFGYAIDYGEFDIATRNLGQERATEAALNEWRDEIEAGWMMVDGGLYTPDLVLVDARYQTPIVKAFCASGDAKRYRPSMGYGQNQERLKTYLPPKSTNKEIVKIGPHYHVAYDRESRVWVIHVNGDFWKSRLHERLTQPVNEKGSIRLYDAPPHEHRQLAQQITAESALDEFIPGKGTRTVWKRHRKHNHKLDCMYNALAGSDLYGAAVAVRRKMAATAPTTAKQTRPRNPRDFFSLR